jgi:hypothetical protein
VNAAELRPADLDPELEAALIGDFEALRQGSEDARRFELSFSSRPGRPWWREEAPEGLLGSAAQAVGCERRGELEVAASLYPLVVAGGGWFALLGLMLQGWSQTTTGSEPVHAAAALLGAQRRGARKARLLTKLSLLAADKGSPDTARDLLAEAIAASSPSTRLGRALRVEGINLGIVAEQTEIHHPLPGAPDDPLLRPEELVALELRAARGALEERLEDSLGGTWRYTIRMGSRPIDELAAADAQATWSGLPWLRREVRKQTGAQLLAGAAEEEPGQWAHGVLLWTLGGARQCGLVLALAEPHLDAGGADFVLRGVGDFDPTRNRHQRLAELGSEGWDLLGEDTLRWLVGEVEPLEGAGSPGPESRHIWAGFALRLSAEWFERYRGLEPTLQRELLGHLTPYALRHFDARVREVMFAALDEDEEALAAEGGALLPIAAALAPPGAEARLRRLIARAGLHPRVLAQLIVERPELVGAGVEKRMLSRLGKAVREDRREAARGTVGLGGPGPRRELGRLLSLVETPPRRLVDLLLAEACDPKAPPQYVTEAREGLVLLRRAHGLSAPDRRRLRAAPDHAGQGPFDEGLTRAVLRMRLLQVLADRPNKGERAELVAAVRSPEDRVRDIAVNACAEALERSEDEGLAWALVSGLFDPSGTVAAGALAGLGALGASFPAAADVAWARLPELFASGGREVRAQVVAAVSEARPRNRHQRERRRAILARARQDRSWLVRDRLDATGGRRPGSP